MMKKIILILFFITLTSVGIYFANGMKSSPTITYFPIDYGTGFEVSETSLQLDDVMESYNVLWNVHSKTEVPMYLRQDVSLLYKDGMLHGMRSKWRENTDSISFSERTSDNKSRKWEAISFHYGEIHSDETINSTQHLSHDELYVLKENNQFEGFHKYNNESNLISLDKEIKKKLLAHWQDLLFYFHIDMNDYHLVPLTSLYLYQENPLPNLDQETTNRVMGQLWEGLYKNYIIPYIDTTETLDSYVPLILIDKESETLLVLFEMNGKKEKLIQKIGS